MTPIVSYAEFHNSTSFLVKRYLQKEPEIIADLPFRAAKEYIPLTLIIKNAHLYNVLICDLDIEIVGKDTKKDFLIEINQEISAEYKSFVYNLRLASFTKDQYLQARVKIKYKINGNEKICCQDNYLKLDSKIFEFYYSNDLIPFPHDWRLGDIHSHSNNTNKSSKFGADITTTTLMADAVGLDWVCISDHNLATNNLDKENHQVQIIASKESAITNSNKKALKILSISNKKKELIIASNPFSKISLLEKLFSKQRSWSKEDILNNKISYLEILSGSFDETFFKSINIWKELLLDGHKVMILGGNNAYGNFNIERDLKLPFFRLYQKREQLFGRCFTGVLSTKENFIEQIEEGRIVISNGPFINLLCEEQGHIYELGDTIFPSTISLNIVFGSTQEFGNEIDVTIYYGNYNTKTEIDITKKRKEFSIPYDGYFRAELRTNKGYFAYTNPIWIKTKEV